MNQLSPEEERDKELMSDLKAVHPDEVSWYKVSITQTIVSYN